MALALAPNWYKSQAIAEQQGAGLTGTALSLHMLRIWAMATPGRVLDQVWLTILAGGEGQRMRSFVERWLGHHRPKQYCAFVGTRSMFQHTVDRALQLIRPEHIIAVVAQHHREDVQDQLTDRHIGTVIHQPDNRETAAGIFLALTYVHAEDPNRTVVIFPSDHFIYPEACFLDLVRQAIAVTEALPDRLVLLGAEPDRLELDYGWMVPGALLPVSGSQTRVRGLTAFLEKPSPREADEALRSGALWNTFVMAAKADTLWKLGWVCFPDVMSRFEPETGDRIAGRMPSVEHHL